MLQGERRRLPTVVLGAELGRSIGEESYAAGERQELTDEYTWMVDPIDVSSLGMPCGRSVLTPH